MSNLAEPSITATEKGELCLSGLAVSRGIASGRAIRIFGSRHQFFRRQIDGSEVENELGRFRAAARMASSQIKEILATGGVSGANRHKIFDVHLLIAEDPEFVSAIETAIATDLICAEWAVDRVTETLVARQNLAADKAFREKSVEIQDVSDRVMRSFGSSATLSQELIDGSVIVATTIRPSTLVELSRHRPVAVVTEHGGWTSHVFIMAREMSIPAVTGVSDILRLVDDGEGILVDGFAGRVTIRPAELQNHTVSEKAGYGILRGESTDPPANSRTLDGREVLIRANAENVDSIKDAIDLGARGVGLLRSEHLFVLSAGDLPSENEQIAAYSAIIEAAAPHKVRIRTFDLNIDHSARYRDHQENNPSLGLRAIRLSLANEEGFRRQVRAVLRASSGRDVELILPMVTGVDEIVRAKEIIGQERLALLQSGIPAGDAGIGAMIEVPSAVLMIDAILRIVDFICLGTNDLVQYLLAVDRDNEQVADYYQTLHPAVIWSLRRVIAAAEAANVPAVVCGEMAGSPFYAPVLVGLGAREFSMNVNSIGLVRTVIEGISFDESASLARSLESANTAAEAEDFVRQAFSVTWPHLIP